MIAAQRLDPLAILQALFPPLRFLVSTMNILLCYEYVFIFCMTA